jgi:hypothetical protein
MTRPYFEDELGEPKFSRTPPEFLPISYPDDQFEGRWSAIQDRMEKRPEEFEEPMERFE